MAATKIRIKPRSSLPWNVTQYDSQATLNSDVIEAAKPVAFLDAIILNKGSSTLYAMFFDAASLPANATVPLFQPIPVAAGTQVIFSLSDIAGGSELLGLPVVTGLVWAASTTVANLTVDATASLWMTVHYLGGL